MRVPGADFSPERDRPAGHDEKANDDRALSSLPTPDESEWKSRSRKKRESTALQHCGEELAALSPAVLAKLPLGPDLAEALFLWRGLKTHEAKRRHMQYIGRLMREMDDPESLLSALEDLKTETSRNAGRFARLERLRDALLDPSESARAAALDQALTDLPELDRARIAHLVEAALADREKKRPPRHARELFRYLRDAWEG